MNKVSILYEKIINKLKSAIIRKSRNTVIYNYLYISYWHSILSNSELEDANKNYLTAMPNKGAGIGHQLANWIAGYWFAKFFNLNYAYTPFPDKKWNDFFSFYQNEISVKELIRADGYKKVSLPLFSEKNEEEIQVIKNIIKSYANKKIIFICEQDQYYKNQYDVIDDLKEKFHTAHIRENETLKYDKQKLNIAVHVRRGDITIGQLNKNPNLIMRWQDNDYFKNVLISILSTINTNKKICVYIFSQGKEEDYKEFNEIENIELIFCLDMGAKESFLHMIYADILITSKSSFSYKPALLSNGIKVCPENFWHGYPQDKSWILADEKGNINKEVQL